MLLPIGCLAGALAALALLLLVQRAGWTGRRAPLAAMALALRTAGLALPRIR